MARKVRFTIDPPAQTSELFSVQESHDRSLGIFIKKPVQISDLSGIGFADVQQMRISVHVTEDRIWNTLVAHLQQRDGIYRKLYSRVVPVEDGLVWPCFSMATQDLSQSRYASRPKGCDETVSLGSYHPGYGVLTYFVVAAAAGTELPILHGMKPRTVRFSRFDVHVYHCFMLSMSLQQGVFAIPVTHAEAQIEGEAWTLSNTPNVSRSFGVEHLESWFGELLTRFSEQHVIHLTKQLSSEGDELPEAAVALARKFTATPHFPK